nr:manganese-dependent ADP-ribose/CDP-alcohol diphosphatase-like [Hydra vulgaris]
MDNCIHLDELSKELLLDEFKKAFKTLEKDKAVGSDEINDVQYADVDNRYNYTKTNLRYYRNAINNLKDAISTWNDSKFDSCGLPVSKQEGTYVSEKDSSKIVPYICHVWGNHDFYNFSREMLWKSSLNSFIKSCNLYSEHNASSHNYDYYYSFTFKTFRIIALDTYDISTCGRASHTDEWKLATSLLKEYNKNDEKAEPYLCSPQYVSWNGAISEKQLLWLHDELIDASKNKQKVILLSHIPLHLKASTENTVCWNFNEILSTIYSYKCVVACFAGHFHDGEFYHDQQSNIYFVTLPGVVEREVNKNAFAIVNVFENYIEINGFGELCSQKLLFSLIFYLICDKSKPKFKY